MSKTRKNDHVVMGDNSVCCLNCGREQLLAFPISLNVMVAAGEAFGKDHRSCKPSEGGRKRFEFSTPSEWLESWDTGSSSKTIFRALAGYAPDRPGRAPFTPDVPRDPGDFGRCYRLLTKISGWRERLPEVANMFPFWKPFVESWGELEKLYEKELSSDSEPKQLYAAMRPLVDQALAIKDRRDHG